MHNHRAFNMEIKAICRFFLVLCFFILNLSFTNAQTPRQSEPLWSAIDSAEMLKLKGRYDEAIALLSGIKQHAQSANDIGLLAKCNVEQADVLRFTYYFTRDSLTIEEALQLLDEVSKMRYSDGEKLIDVLPRYHIYLGKLIRDKGYAYGMQYADTVMHFLNKAKMALDKLPDSNIEWAKFHYESGIYFANTGSEKEAEQHFNRLLELLVQHFDELNYFRGLYLYEAGAFFFDIADLEKSLLCTNLALHIFMHPENPDINRALSAEILIANAHYSSNVLSEAGYSDALFHYRNALDLMQKANRQNVTNETIILSNMGLALYRLQMYDSSLLTVKRAIAVNPADWTFEKSLLAMSFVNLGLLSSQNGEKSEAKMYFEKAIELTVSTIGTKHYRTHLVYRMIGEAYELKGDYNLALQYYQKGLNALFEYFDDQDIYQNPQWESADNIEPVLYILFGKAGTLFKRYQKNGIPDDLIAALELYNRGYDLMNEFLGKEMMSESVIMFFRNFKSGFETSVECVFTACDVYRSAQYFDYALKFMEQSKYFLLLKSQQNAQMREKFEGNAQLFLKERALNGEIEHLKHLLERDNKTDVKKTFEIRNTILNRSVEKSALWKKINIEAVAIPDYQESPVITVQAVRKDLIQERETIIEYFRAENSIYAMIITNSKCEKLTIPITQYLLDQISTFRNLLSGNVQAGVSEKSLFVQYLNASYALYNILFEPVINLTDDEFFMENRPVTIIADGELALLPFEAFTTNHTDTSVVSYWGLPYLCHNYNFNYAYSLKIQKRHQASPRQANTRGVLAMSYSAELSNETDLVKLRSENELPYSGKEVEVVSGIFKHTRSRTFHEATEDQFKTYAPQHSIIHLAIHGHADPLDKYNSKLMFKSHESSREDGQLHAYELYNLDLGKSQLAVLSACETGIGKQLEGEGIFSIARGFAYAGCPSVVMSLWKVNDKSTSILMQYYYENLASGMTKDLALQQAKLSYLRNADDYGAHPAHWAAFVSMGSNNPVVLGSAHSWSSMTLLGILVAVLAVVLFRYREKRLA